MTDSWGMLFTQVNSNAEPSFKKLITGRAWPTPWPRSWSTPRFVHTRKFEQNAAKRTEESRRCDRLTEHVVYTDLQQC